MYLVLLKQQFRLEIVDLQAHAANAILSEKVRVIVGTTVARAVQDRLHTAHGLGIFLSCLRLLPRQRLAALVGVRGRWNWVLLVHRMQIIRILAGRPAKPVIKAWPRSAQVVRVLISRAPHAKTAIRACALRSLLDMPF